MKLFALGDLHLANRSNREALVELPAQPEDWLILAGDVGETEAHLRFALETLVPRFKQLLWVPGNHDLWTLATDPSPLKGEAKYLRLVEICRSFGVLTPEDPYPRWPGLGPSGRRYRLAPLFLLYDYTFRPDDVPAQEAVSWASESGVMCSDEILLHYHPHPSREAWCAARLTLSERRLEAAAASGDELILINHWPLREDLVHLRRIPRFSIWCGSKATEDWHTRFNAAVVVHGHLHIKNTHFRDGVRFEEVSLGYPRDWNRHRGVAFYLRQILPEPETWLAER
ncbi:MAG: metallophosphoesterase [Deltaproteobacteria bacterium]|nr:metallophosphoesterase [Deltaproteobacteria bacterium]